MTQIHKQGKRGPERRDNTKVSRTNNHIKDRIINKTNTKTLQTEQLTNQAQTLHTNSYRNK